MGLSKVIACALMYIALGLAEARWPNLWKNLAAGAPRVPFGRTFDPLSTLIVTAECNDTAVYVEVVTNGQLVDFAALMLGGCPATREDLAAQVFIYESNLDGCNSKLTVSLYFFFSTSTLLLLKTLSLAFLVLLGDRG